MAQLEHPPRQTRSRSTVVLTDTQIKNGGGGARHQVRRERANAGGGALKLEPASGEAARRAVAALSPMRCSHPAPGREGRLGTFDGDAVPPVTPTHQQSWQRGVQPWAVGAGPESRVQGRAVGCSASSSDLLHPTRLTPLSPQFQTRDLLAGPPPSEVQRGA